MSITITKEERDALYERILMRLNGIDDVYGVVEREDWAAAQKLGEEFSDLLRFVCSDLGWGQRSEEKLELRAPSDVLARAAEALRRLALYEREHFEGEGRRIEEEADEARFLQRTCERLLGELQGPDE